MKENGGKSPQVSGFSLFSRALAPYFGPQKELPGFLHFFSFKTQYIHIFWH